MVEAKDLERVLAENDSLRRRVTELERRLARSGPHGAEEQTDFAREINERAALLAEAERLAHLGSFIWDVPTDRVIWSYELYRILGYDPEKDAASTEAFFARIHPLDLARVQASTQHATRTGTSEPIEYRLLLPGNRVRDVTMDAALLFDEHGALQRAVGALLDVTESRQAREENRRIQTLLEETERLTSSGSWEWYSATNTVAWTPPLYDLLGVPRTEVPTSELFESCLHPEDREQYRALRAQALSSGEVLSSFECRIVRPNSEVRKVRFVTASVHDAHGQFVGARGTITDITLRSKLEEQLHQARKMEAIGQLSGGIAHDFNNLLMVLFGAVERLRFGDDANECIADIETAARSAATLTQRLLAFSRKAVLTPTLTDLSVVVEEMRALVSRTIGEHIRTRFDYAERPLMVRVDPHQAQQLLLNLVVNARDAMPDGGRLLVRLERATVDARSALDLSPGAYAVLLVADTGMGMDSATLTRIFEPFFTTKSIGQGTGLGLSVVYGAMKQCGGTVAVESTVGTGTTFRLYFPLEQGVAAPRERASAPAPSRGRVLLVEDDNDVRRAVSGMLKRAGFTTIATTGAEQALQEWERLAGEVDVLVTDVVMPGVQGDRLAEQLLARKPDLRILFITGYAERSLVGEQLQDRARVLQKPFSSSDLLEALEKLQG